MFEVIMPGAEVVIGGTSSDLKIVATVVCVNIYANYHIRYTVSYFDDKTNHEIVLEASQVRIKSGIDKKIKIGFA